MLRFFMSPKIEVRDSKKGRGVFATEAFREGELIEVAPLLVVPLEDKEAIATSFLKNYIFGHDPVFVALGYGSIYNDSENSNASFAVKDDTVTFTAKSDIVSGTEITITYGWNSKKWKTAGGRIT